MNILQYIRLFFATKEEVAFNENTTNKTTSITSSSTDTQYSSAKSVYDIINSHTHSLGSDVVESDHYQTVTGTQKSLWTNKLDVDDVSDVALSGDYDDLSGKPSIPSKTSDLTNDSGFVDSSYHDSSKQDSISDLGVIRANAVLGATALQEEDVSDVAISGDYTDLSNKPSIPSKTSDLTNDSDFVTTDYHDSSKSDTTHTHDERYYTETETNTLLNGKVDKVSGKGLSTVDFTDTNYVHTDNNYTSTEKDKLSGLSNYDDTEVKEDIEDLQSDKQDVISDLSTIRSGASLGATALQGSDVVNNVASYETSKPLSANMGKELQDQITNLSARGRYLSIWDCNTGLPRTDPVRTGDYEYKAGDYYVVGTVATGGCTHTINISGSTVALNGELGTYNVSFSFKNQVSSAYTTPSDVAEILGETGVSATGTLVTSSQTYTITSVQEWTEGGVKVIAMRTEDYQKAGLTVTGATTLTDTVTGSVSTVNYKPDGGSYTPRVASTTVESSDVSTEDVYYYDGSLWKLQINSQKTVSFANLSGSPSDNSNLATALNDKASTSDVTTAISEHNNSNDAHSSLLSNYSTVSDLSNHNTSSNAHNSLLSNYVLSDDLSDVATTGDYEDLSNTPNLKTVATSGSYTDLSNKPSIPSKTSDLTNDGDGTNAFLTSHQSLANYSTTTQMNTAISNYHDSTKADTDDIPTKTSDLTNDSSFVVDSSYVHTDNNYTTSEKDKLGSITVANLELNTNKQTTSLDVSSAGDNTHYPTTKVMIDWVKAYIDSLDGDDIEY